MASSTPNMAPVNKSVSYGLSATGIQTDHKDNGDLSWLYRKLPPELKLNVWEQMSMTNGLHTFCLTTDLVRDPGRSQDVRVIPLTRPGDNSAWRIRNRAKWVDVFSWDVLSKKNEGKPDTRQFYPRHFDTGHPQRQHRGVGVAIVNLTNDIVCFKYDDMPIHTHITPMDPWQEFHGVTRVALKWKVSVGSRPSRPHGCPCRDFRHIHMTLCHTNLEAFMSYFKDLKTFYFLFKVTQTTVKSLNRTAVAAAKAKGKASRTRNTTVASSSKAKKTPSQSKKAAPKETKEQLVSRYMSEFRDTAIREGLETFEDKKYHYYEVREKDMMDKFNQNTMWNVFRDLEKWYTKYKKRGRSYMGKDVQYKVLVYAEPKK